LGVGRQDQVFPALAFVDASRTYILQRHLPGVHDGAVDYTVIGGRNLQHHGTGVLGVEERHQIEITSGFGVSVWFFQSSNRDQ